MDRKGLPVVLAVLLIASTAAGSVSDAPWRWRVRVLMVEGEEKGQARGQGQIPPPPVLAISPPDGSSPNTHQVGANQETGSGNSGQAGSKTPPVPGSPSNPQPSNLTNGPPPASPGGMSKSPPTPESSLVPPPPPPSSDIPLSPPPPPVPSSLNPPPTQTPNSGSPLKPSKSESRNNISPPPGESKGGGNGDQGPRKKGDAGNAGSNDSESSTDKVEKCPANSIRCWGSVVACFRQTPEDSKKVFLVIQNEGKSPRNVTVKVSPSTDISPRTLAKNIPEKIELPSDSTKNSEIVLYSGKKYCTLQSRKPVPSDSFFQQFPSYTTLVTPMYGAYAIVLTFLVAGGAWACCKFRKRVRRVDASIPYQQLEMGIQPESTSIMVDDTNAADSWDEGWHDDWDDEETVSRPPETQHGENISENGVASKSSAKDGWEDWDD